MQMATGVSGLFKSTDDENDNGASDYSGGDNYSFDSVADDSAKQRRQISTLMGYSGMGAKMSGSGL